MKVLMPGAMKLPRHGMGGRRVIASGAGYHWDVNIV